MLVEDSKVERRATTGYLRDWQLEFLEAEHGHAAWKILQKPSPPDLVLLDWLLPGIDGIELCRRIRTLSSAGTYIYTVMLTRWTASKIYCWLWKLELMII